MKGLFMGYKDIVTDTHELLTYLANSDICIFVFVN